MDNTFFTRLLRNLLQVSVMEITDLKKDLKNFEEKYCFHPALQPMFTEEALSLLFNSAESGILYEIVDQLNVSISFFVFSNKYYLIGPYVKTPFSGEETDAVLIKNHITSANSVSLKLYYTSFPILYVNQIQNTINGCIQSFNSNAMPYKYRRLSGIMQQNVKDKPGTTIKELDYGEIYKRYDVENQFLAMIRNGDVEHVSLAFQALTNNSISSSFHINNEPYQNPLVSFALLRALTRKAAEQSGLSVITIDEITQKYVQLINSTISIPEQMKYDYDMIIELTQAVHNFTLSVSNYSPEIRKVVEYIRYHFSDDISLSDIAERVPVSLSHLSKQFKKETGMTFGTYVANVRCKKAAELLIDTTLSISEISNFVGYSDNNYFVKVFRKFYHVTPTDYRKKELEKSYVQTM